MVFRDRREALGKAQRPRRGARGELQRRGEGVRALAHERRGRRGQGVEVRLAPPLRRADQYLGTRRV